MVLFFSSGGSTLPVTACITGFAFDRTGLHLLRPKPVANVDVHIVRLQGLAPRNSAVHGGILLVKLIPNFTNNTRLPLAVFWSFFTTLARVATP